MLLFPMMVRYEDEPAPVVRIRDSDEIKWVWDAFHARRILVSDRVRKRRSSWCEPRPIPAVMRRLSDEDRWVDVAPDQLLCVLVRSRRVIPEDRLDKKVVGESSHRLVESNPLIFLPNAFDSAIAPTTAPLI